jgi:uncharacterized membrane protein
MMKVVVWRNLMLRGLSKNPWLRFAIAVAIAFFVISLILTLNRYYSFFASYDQGIFHQVFWNNAHGRWFQSSLSSTLSTDVVHAGEVPDVTYRRLGQHFTPALLVWLPIYLLFPSPATLTVIQVSVVTAAGIVLYFLARQYLQPPVSAFISASFYSANAVIGPTWSNFHDLSQVPLYCFTLLLAMEKRWWWLFWLMVVLLLAVREDTGITLFGIGVYMVFSNRFPRLGLGICTIGFLYVTVVTNVVMLQFSEDMLRRFPLERFGQFAPNEEEASTLEILWNMLSQPWQLVAALFREPLTKLGYLFGQLLPFAFIPLVSAAAWTIAGFPLLKIFLQRGDSALVISLRYAIGVVPGLAYGTIRWWRQRETLLFYPVSSVVRYVAVELREKATHWPRKGNPLEPTKSFPETQKSRGGFTFKRFWIACMLLSVLLSVTASPSRTLYFLIPDSFDPWVYVSLPRQWQHAEQIRSLLSEIPEDASVAATTYIVPPLSGRRELIRFPALKLRNDARDVIWVDYAIADLWRLQTYMPAFDNDRIRLRGMIPRIDSVTTAGKYGITDVRDGVVLLQKGKNSDPEAWQKWQQYRSVLLQDLQKWSEKDED